MAQVSMTVRVDAVKKKQFDELCSQFGMSANTAMNLFVYEVVRSGSIPFEIRGDRGKTVFYELRAEAQQNGVADMSLDEINEEIRLAREERDKRN